MVYKTAALFVIFGTLFITNGIASFSSDPRSRHVEIMNQSGRNMKVYWINPMTHEAVEFTDHNTIHDGASLSVNSYVNHTLMVHEMTEDNTTDSCLDSNDGCVVSYITVSDSQDNQVFFVREGMEIDNKDILTAAKEEASDAVTYCKNVTLKDLVSLEEVTDQTVESFLSCVEEVSAETLAEKNEEIAFEAKAREHVSDLLENYTCADNDLATTTALETHTWVHKNETVHEVHVLHQRAASQIHLLKDFITPEECQAIEDAAQPVLHRGTVADGAGGSRLSDHRKAWQAGVRIPWEKEQDGDPIARVTRRVYDYTNHATGYGLKVEGQEDIMSIQYFALGEAEEEQAPDQYRPHCDGDCSGLPHKTGGRLATVVMYCTAPEEGGSTNFGHAGVHVKPELYAAVFFSYMDPKTKLMEKGFTTHSGCPVTRGTKRIAVQWMRLGVNEENPWDSFNTLTIKKGREEEDC